MAIEFKLPDLGENIDSGDVVSLLVQEGDRIEAEQPVIEIETDKAVVEVPCPHAGRISKIHVQKGDTIQVGGSLLTIETGDEAEAEEEAEVEEPATQEVEPAEELEEAVEEPEEAVEDEEYEEEVEVEEPQPRRVSVAREGDGQKPKTARRPGGGPTAPAAPSTRRLARELGVDLTSVQGSGPGGRITQEDVMAAVRQAKKPAAAKPAAKPSPKSAAAAAPARPAEPDGDRDSWGPIRTEPMTKIRRTIAANMARSAQTIPHVTNFDEADVTELERIRQQSKASLDAANVKLTSLAFVTKAVAYALKQHPMLNASIDTEGEQIIYKEYVNIGIAVDTERGLIVPVIRDVPSLSIPEIAEELGKVSQKARSSQFSVQDLRGGTFTISNLGAVGGIYSTPIINHPEVGVLLVGRSRRVPVVREDDKVEVRLMMPLSLSYDHRLVDGATAARFLNEVIGYLESPGRLLFAK